MKEKIASRFQELIKESAQFMRSSDKEIYVEGRLEPACHAWLDSVANLLQLVAPKQSHYFTESKQVMSEKAKYPNIQNSTVKRMFGLLTSAKTEWDHGLLVE